MLAGVVSCSIALVDKAPAPRWRNWQTRTTQNRVSQEVRVRFPPAAPRTTGCMAAPSGVVRQRLWGVRGAPSGAPPRWYNNLMKFYCVYVLKSLRKDFIYVGYTVNL